MPENIFYQNLFKTLGLNAGEIQVYSFLLRQGAQTGRQISHGTELSRTNAYNILAKLVKDGLIEEKKEQKRALYRPMHPNVLQELVEKKEKVLNQAKSELEVTLPAIISDYNLAVSRPGIRFYEGEEALVKIPADSLTAKSVILSYVDVEAVEKHIKKFNEDYVVKRTKLGKKKKIIVPQSEFNKKYFKQLAKEMTDVRYIDFQMPPFGSVMMIYDNKISYLTLEPKNRIGIIIEDERLTKMNRALFEYLWSTGKPTSLMI